MDLVDAFLGMLLGKDLKESSLAAFAFSIAAGDIPSGWPQAFAAAKPALVHSLMISRSNSARGGENVKGEAAGGRSGIDA